MKNFLILFLLLFTSQSLANVPNYEKCHSIASEAETTKGYEYMILFCLNDHNKLKTKFYNRSKGYKCVKNAYKLKTENAFDYSFISCMQSN